jgi:hypothetical protein
MAKDKTVETDVDIDVEETPEGSTVDLSALDDFNEEFDSAEAATFDNLPNGTYEARVESAILSKSTKDNPMIKWSLVVTKSPKDPELIGRYAFKNNMLQPENFPYLKADLANCEIDLKPPLSKNLPKVLKQLLDLVLEIRIKANKDPDFPPNVYIKKRVGVWDRETQDGGTDGPDIISPYDYRPF